MKRTYLLALAVAAALTAAPLAGLQDSQKAVTVGDFAVKMSRALGFAAPDRASALASLQAIGVNLGSDLDARVTEGLASDILGSLGVKAATSNPQGPISAARADSLVTALALTSLQGLSTEDFPPPPTQCLQLKRNKCEACCRKAVRDPHDQDLRGGRLEKLCRRFCKTGEFPSPSEPGT